MAKFGEPQRPAFPILILVRVFIGLGWAARETGPPFFHRSLSRLACFRKFNLIESVGYDYSAMNTVTRLQFGRSLMKQLITILLLVIFFASPLLAQTQSVVTKPALHAQKQSRSVLVRKHHKRHHKKNNKKHGRKVARNHDAAAAPKAQPAPATPLESTSR